MSKNQDVKLLDLYVDAYIKNKEKRIAVIDSVDFDRGAIKVYFFDNEEEKYIQFEDVLEIMKTNADLEIGDKVKIETVFFKDDKDETNPFNTEGEVFEDDGYWIYVNWKNGQQNSYRKLDADLFKI